MNRPVVVLSVICLAEMIVCGVLVGRRLNRVEPAVPAVPIDDPLFVDDLNDLAEKARSGSARDRQKLAEALLGYGFYTYAEINYRRVLELDPDRLEARYGLAFCLDRTGRVDASSAEYRRIVEAESHTQTARTLHRFSLYAIGRNHLRNGDVEKAAPAFRRNDGFLPAEYQSAHLHLERGDIDADLGIIDEALGRVPDSLVFQFLKYRCARARNNPDQARAAARMLERTRYQVPINLSTDYVEPISQRYGLPERVAEYNRRLQGGDLDGVRRVLERTLDVVRGKPLPQYEDLLVALIEVEFQAGNRERIAQLLDEAESQGMHSHRLLAYRGAFHAMAGEMDRALGFWNRALTLADDAQLHQAMARHYEEQANVEARDRHRAAALTIRAKQAYWQDDLSRAAKMIDKAVELNPSDAQAWYYAGSIQWARGNEGRAVEAFRRSVELNSDQGRALQALEVLAGETEIKQ